MKALRRVALIVVLGSIVSVPAAAQAADASQVFINSNEIKWGDAPPSVPKGAKIAVLYGDPGKPGPFVIRLMAPAGYKIPPHWHSQTENLTIISGALYLGEGDKMDTAHAHALKAGGYHYLPAKAHHYAFTKVATVVQVHGDGPFDINYVNEKDDPQKMAKK
ncbi:MAG TPA: cupin domain-containing protein [Burkholderiales bacterium]|nr:cupin domain-containing protein [Burkholderiales bacterium]